MPILDVCPINTVHSVVSHLYNFVHIYVHRQYIYILILYLNLVSLYIHIKSYRSICTYMCNQFNLVYSSCQCIPDRNRPKILPSSAQRFALGSTGTASDIRGGHGMCDGHGTTPWTSSITTQTWGSKMTTRMRHDPWDQGMPGASCERKSIGNIYINR